MRPIPRNLLIHEAVLHKISNEDRWGNEALDQGTTLEYVRLEPTNKIVRDKNNAEVKLSALMFYDCKNSLPRGISFKEDDIITFNGQSFKVQVAEPLYDRRRLHHYELGLVGHG